MRLPDCFIQGSVGITIACNPWDIPSHHALRTSYVCTLHFTCCIPHLQCVRLFCLGSLWLHFAFEFHICICCGVRERTFGIVLGSFWVRTITVSSANRAGSEACFGTYSNPSNASTFAFGLVGKKECLTYHPISKDFALRSLLAIVKSNGEKRVLFYKYVFKRELKC